MVDVADSKSADGDIVWVRVPPPAPRQKNSVPFRFRGLRKSRENCTSAESFFLSETGVSRGTPVSVITAGSDLDCSGAPRQKKLAAFRFPGSENPGKLHSAPSFFLSKSEDSRGSSDLVLNEGSNLEAPLGPPVSCFQQGTRIIIESPGGAFIDQFKNWSIPLFAPIPREAQMHASPTTSEEARGIPL